jgi:hypothetical protein
LKGGFQVNNSSYADDLPGNWPTLHIQEPSLWSESQERQPDKPHAFLHLTRVAGFSFFMAFSPVTAIVDPWLYDKRRRDSVLTVPVYQEVIGHSISRSGALRIASRILQRAEEERLAIAEFEAGRGLYWGD